MNKIQNYQEKIETGKRQKSTVFQLLVIQNQLSGLEERLDSEPTRFFITKASMVVSTETSAPRGSNENPKSKQLVYLFNDVIIFSKQSNVRFFSFIRFYFLLTSPLEEFQLFDFFSNLIKIPFVSQEY